MESDFTEVFIYFFKSNLFIYLVFLCLSLSLRQVFGGITEK